MKLGIYVCVLVIFGSTEICGEAQNRIDIVNGGEALDNFILYQAHIRFEKEENSWICGGSLISTKYVLTSAKCTYGAKNATITLGAVNIFLNSEPSRQTFSAAKIIPHPDFNEDVLFNDIALLELLGPVAINENVGIIEIAPKSSVYNDLEGQNATVSGWGRLDSFAKFPEKLHVAAMSVVDVRQCEEIYYDLARRERQICILHGTSSDVTICEGDFGGPVVINNILYGVQSFGSPFGCEVGYPIVTSKVAYYWDWINSFISE